MLRRFLPCLFASTILLSASVAWGDDAALAEGTGLRGPRLGFTPGIGIGFAGFTGNVPFSSFVPITTLRIEALVELERFGFFLRGEYLTAGPTNLWNGPAVSTGLQYRLKGDGEERWGLVARAGVIYERWSAAVGSCDVFWVIPNSCQNFVESPTPVPGQPIPAPPPSITADAVGLLAALRLEVPVEPVYVAFDAELSGAADVDQSIPGAIITGELVLTFALRDHVRKNNNPQRFRRRYY